MLNILTEELYVSVCTEDCSVVKVEIKMGFLRTKGKKLEAKSLWNIKNVIKLQKHKNNLQGDDTAINNSHFKIFFFPLFFVSFSVVKPIIVFKSLIDCLFYAPFFLL